LSLYVHLPWCLRKCPYCDFNSHEVSAILSQAHPEPATCLRRPKPATSMPCAPTSNRPCPRSGAAGLHRFHRWRHAQPVSPDSIDRLLSDIRARLPLEADAEITLEANPGTFETDRFKAFHQAGINRLSIGVQSFDDAKLRALGRVHNRAQAIAAVEEAQRNFETFNLDLMYALPGQSSDDLDADIQQALAFEPPHLSLYHLTLEPNTRFATQPPKGLPDEDTAFDMLDHLIERTMAAGLQRYEVSAYARPGHASAHNLNYWQFGDYLGIGAGAHSKISFPDRIVRQVRWREPAAYMDKAMQGLALSNEQDVPLKSRAFEFMMNALRLKDGFELLRFTERTGLTLASIQQPLAQAEAKGLLARDLVRAWPTEKGFDFLSDLQGLFLQD
jgi:putative oxygen-independent coproporphyrinogen III oxidase